MTERERLIEIMNKCDAMSIPTDGFIEGFADYLLENGINVPPCKIGDTIYLLKTLCDGKNTVVIEADIVSSFVITKKQILAMISDYHSISNDGFGKIAFLTREEAEKALKTNTMIS